MVSYRRQAQPTRFIKKRTIPYRDKDRPLWFKQDRALSARVANDLVPAQRFCYNEDVRRVLDDPSTTFFDLNCHLTEMRAKNPWLAEPSAWIQRSAMRQGMEAVHAFRESNFRKHFEEKSRWSGQRSLFRRRGGRRLPALAAFCPPIRREGNALYLPGIGLVLATGKIPDGDIRPFQLVETTRKITRLTRPDGRTFRLHVPVKELERAESKSARGVDVGAVHMAATADTGGRTHVFGLPDGARRRNGDGIGGLRGKAGRQKGRSRGWRETMGRVHAKGRKIRNRQINAERHAAREIADGVGTVVIEDLHPKPMTAKGGRRKRAMNRGMRYGRVGALLARIRLTAENAGVRAVKADPRGTSITCVECGHADRDSRRSRSVFICVRCGHGADADINAARNLPARRQDMSSKGPSAPSRSTPGLSGNGRIGGDPGNPRKVRESQAQGGMPEGQKKRCCACRLAAGAGSLPVPYKKNPCRDQNIPLN